MIRIKFQIVPPFGRKAQVFFRTCLLVLDLGVGAVRLNLGGGAVRLNLGGGAVRLV